VILHGSPALCMVIPGKIATPAKPGAGRYDGDFSGKGLGVPIEVLYADASLIVVNKPADMLSVPGRGEAKQDCCSARVQALYADAQVVHRLDMATSGLLLFARGADCQRHLSMQFQARTVEKTYVAVVSGQLVQCVHPWQTINLPLITDWPNRPRSKVDWEIGKPSVTQWQVQHYHAATDQTRVTLVPVTGRSHQLRVHLLALGHPIVGDALYAPETKEAASRMLLHAQDLSVTHPLDQRRLHFNCPADF